MSRQNLTILTGALACRLVFKARRATGLVIRQDGAERTLAARREIVLCGGAYASPQLLVLSGIGGGKEVQSLGIPLLHDLPGVGRNFQDHASLPMLLTDPSNTAYALNWKRMPHLVSEFLRYVFSREGTLASNVVEAGGFIRTRDGLPAPDIQYVFMPTIKRNSQAVPRSHGFLITPVLLRPASRGHIAIVAPDPATKPVIYGNFLSEEPDLRALTSGMAMLRRIVTAPAFDRFRGTEILPGPDVQSDAELASFAFNNVSTIYHPVGTCKMGPDADNQAVVDARLRVRGVQGVRIADCAIMPTIVSGNTNGPAMMIGERAAAFIAKDLA